MDRPDAAKPANAANNPDPADPANVPDRMNTTEPDRADSPDPALPVASDSRKRPRSASPSDESAMQVEKSVMNMLSHADPYNYFTDEAMNSFLRCSYKWSFFHIPTLLSEVRSRTVNEPILWAILALSIRFSSTPPAPFQTQIAASNAFAAYARTLIQPLLESPDVDLVRALLMITGHSWGAGDGSKAWEYLGLAINMTKSLGLLEELPTYQKAAVTEDEFVEAETRRRVGWTCFLMDSLLSGGRGRKRVLSSADMKIQLPCQDEYYMFGEPVRCEALSGLPVSRTATTPSSPSPHSLTTPGIRFIQPTSQLGIVAYSMRVADIWGNVARWACSSDMASQIPWLPSSNHYRLMTQATTWKKSLSTRLEFRTSGLHAHTAMGQGQAYVYMHSVYFMCLMFLHRAYIPILGPERKDQLGLTPATIAAPSQPWASTGLAGNREDWDRWQISCRRGLFSTAVTVLDMMEEIRTFGIYFLRGLVPWIGFTIYTAVGVMLYCYNFPTPDDDPEIVRRAKERVVTGCVFLRQLKNQWPMADSQFLTIRRMQAFYHRIRTRKPGTTISAERSVLGEALIDYAAVNALAPTVAGSGKDTFPPLRPGYRPPRPPQPPPPSFSSSPASMPTGPSSVSSIPLSSPASYRFSPVASSSTSFEPDSCNGFGPTSHVHLPPPGDTVTPPPLVTRVGTLKATHSQPSLSQLPPPGRSVASSYHPHPPPPPPPPPHFSAPQMKPHLHAHSHSFSHPHTHVHTQLQPPPPPPLSQSLHRLGITPLVSSAPAAPLQSGPAQNVITPSHPFETAHLLDHTVVSNVDGAGSVAVNGHIHGTTNPNARFGTGTNHLLNAGQGHGLAPNTNAQFGTHLNQNRTSGMNGGTGTNTGVHPPIDINSAMNQSQPFGPGPNVDGNVGAGADPCASVNAVNNVVLDVDVYTNVPADEGVDVDSLLAGATDYFWTSFPGEFWFPPEGFVST